ncbi:MAG: 30S ribosomal protein S18 [Actinomycetota bacterium]|nr:30S ribosomal protein S18 [Actinomycetota bacterium]
MAKTRSTRTKRRRPSDDRGRRKRIVYRFKEDEFVDYKDVALLRKFMSDRGKIRSRRVTGLNEKRQHQVATAIKNAREMALLPYISTRQSK